MNSAGPLRIHTAHLTDRGRVRDENQDACVELHGAAGEQLLVVADGMGGHRGGSTASRLLIETVRETFEAAPCWDGETLRAAIAEANARICQAANDSLELMGMGTTVVAVLIGSELDAAWLAHVGDSRAYRLRAGVFQQLTEDHSVVAELVRRGAITESEAVDHPRRNEILRSVGIQPDVEIDLASLSLQRGDRLLLCSDGLSGLVPGDEIAAILNASQPIDAVSQLVEAASARGSPDNVTVIVSVLTAETQNIAPTAAAFHSRRRWVAAGAAVAILLLVYALIWVLRVAPPGNAPTTESLAIGESAMDPAAPPPVGSAPPTDSAPAQAEAPGETAP
jgi:protein phosphatase